MKPHLCRIRSLFSEFHDLKTETSMRWKEPFERQCPLLQYRKSGNTLTYYLNRIKVQEWLAMDFCRMVISRMNIYFSLLSNGQFMEVFQLLSRFSNLEKIQPFQKLILREKFTFFQMSRYHDSTGAILFLKYLKNNFKIYFSIVIVLYLLRISLCLTCP